MRWFSFAIVFLIPSAALAQPAELTYWQDVRPIFRKHCTVCHNTRNLTKVQVSAGLALDTYEGTKKGTKQPVFVAGNAEKSLLHEVLVTNDAKKRMPLESDPLSKEKIALIKKWIDGGAKEGTPPVEVVAPIAKKAATRKLDVVIPTTAAFPKPAGKLDAALKIGPLAPVTALAFNHDSTLLAVGSYGQVVVWDLAKAQPVKTVTNVLGAVNDVRFSPKGDILAIGGGQPSAKGELQLYQTSDWKPLTTLRGHDDVVFSLAFDSDGKRLASASFDHSVRVWDVAKQASLKEYHHHSDFVYAVAFSPNGKQIASASKDRTVALIDLETGKSAFTFSGMEQDVMALAFHPDGKSVISSGFESQIYWWNPLTDEQVKKTPGHGIAVHELAFSKDGKRIVSAGADRTVRTWDGTAGTALKTMAVGSVAYSVAISPNAKLVASGSFDGLVRLWDEASGRHLATFLAVAEADNADWLAITPEGYANGHDKLTSLMRWRVGGAEVAGDTVWSVLRQPKLVADAIRGQALAAPSFEKK
jgi:hypothetical protein